MPRRSSSRPPTQEEADGAANANSQGSEDLDMAQWVESIVKSSRERQESKRNAVLHDHRNRVSKTRDDIESLFNTHRIKVNNVRRAQLGYLIQLLRKQTDVESKMVSSIRTVEHAYSAHCQELQVILEARAKELD